MNIFLPLVSTLTHSVATIVDKFNFNVTGIKARALMTTVFLAMFGTVAVFLLLTDRPFPEPTFAVAGLLAVIVFVSFAQNVFEIKGIQAMEVYAREPISDLLPVLTSFMAYVLFPSEREIKYLLAIIVSIGILYWAHRPERSWKALFKNGSMYAYMDVTFAALLENIHKFALLTIPPEYIALVRIAGILLLSAIFFRPAIKNVSKRGLALGFASGILFGIAALAKLFSIQYAGLNFTILITLLGPGVMYVLSRLVLRERVRSKQIVGSAVILCLVIITQYL